jgi:hypothetical protein
MATANGLPKPEANIVDIRREELDESLLKLVLQSLDPEDTGPRSLPTLLLYDGRSEVYGFQSFNSCRRQRPD